MAPIIQGRTINKTCFLLNEFLEINNPQYFLSERPYFSNAVVMWSSKNRHKVKQLRFS